MRNTLTTIFT